jgi:chromosome segregation ATPase
MANWLTSGRDHSRRVEALERELASLKTTIASDATRIEQLSAGVSSLAERLSAVVEHAAPIEERVRNDSEELAKMRTSLLSVVALEVERVRELSTTVGALCKAVASLEDAAVPEAVVAQEKRLQQDREDAGKTRTAVLRLERQFNLYVEEARRTGVGLLERIETMRLR